MRSYLYVVMENDTRFDDYGEYECGSISTVAAYSSKEEAEAVALLRNKAAERRMGDDAPGYYVERVVMYS